ncbi:hypothetical protein [Kordiimonas sp. SCSIO 12610]|uniref:hypothetical protein n=1 Tax=Kordiimonas sp. SCSIO 12610 TaxID=2829597 RepID=UPI00210DBDD1|nr:hypothetical protein [Kordiimonas sp. SCSIO 12610]UTW56206.1 hypothetical protein KFF44_04720 [Kordiimonas sp. SCSIO 12610]
MIAIITIVSFNLFYTLKTDSGLFSGSTETQADFSEINETFKTIEKLVTSLSEEQLLRYKLGSGSDEYKHITEDDLLTTRKNANAKLKETITNIETTLSGIKGYPVSHVATALKKYQTERLPIDQPLNIDENMVRQRTILSQYNEVTKSLTDLLHYLAHQPLTPKQRATLLLKLKLNEVAVTTTQSLSGLFSEQLNKNIPEFYTIDTFADFHNQHITYISEARRYGTILDFNTAHYQTLDLVSDDISDVGIEIRDELFFLLTESIESESPLTPDETEETISRVRSYAERLFNYAVLRVPDYISELNLN